MTYSIVFSIFIGTLMIIQWGISYFTGQIIELETEPIRIAFHLAAELITAISLLVSGIGLVRRKTWSPSLNLISIGMLIYTSIVSPGYFAQGGNWGWTFMFGAISIGGVISAIMVARAWIPGDKSEKLVKGSFL